MTAKSKKRECDIRVSSLSHRYYHGLGVCRGNAEFKTFSGAVRSAERKGYKVITKVDPMIQFVKDEHKTKIVTNLQSGKLVRIGKNTPLCCDPSSETYWSM